MDRLSDARALLPWQAGCIRLDTLTVEALLCLRHLEDEEGFERLTCRPVHLRGADELRIRYQTALEDPATLICGVYLQGTLRPVGKLTASNYNSRNRSAEVGYFLAPPWRGKGLMRQALSVLCSMLLLEFGLNKLYAQTGAFNAPSIRLLERVGFRQEGVLRQHHELNGVLWDDAIFSLLQQDYTPDPKRPAGAGR